MEVGYYRTGSSGYPRGVATSDGYVYMADYYHFEIFDCSHAMPVIENPMHKILYEFSLQPPYPNPFNPITTVMIGLPQATQMEVSAFNILGQKVATIADGPYSQGIHHFSFDATGLASGIYFIRASIPGGQHQYQKVVFMR